jgi:hypothetical protein
VSAQRPREEHTLELYNNTNSVCAQKIRLALAEKGLQAKEHMLNLQGDQFDPAYLRLRPQAPASGRLAKRLKTL